MIKAVIFDMDGVIVDTEPVYHDRHYRFLKHHSRNVEKHYLHAMAGASKKQSWKVLKDLWGEEITREDYDRAFNEFHKDNFVHYPELVDEEIYTVLEELAGKNYKIGLASSSEYRVIERVLKECQLQPYFDSILSGEMFTKTKPHPEIYIKSAEKLGVQPHECLAVEDSTIGIQAAKEAGMFVVAKEDTRFNFNQNLADQKVKSLRELLYLLEEK